MRARPGRGRRRKWQTRVRLAKRVGLFMEFKPSDESDKFHAVGIQRDVAPHIIPALKQFSGHKSVAVRDLCHGIENPQSIWDIFSALAILAAAGAILKKAPE